MLIAGPLVLKVLDPLHGEGLASTGLAIGEHGTVVSLQDLLDQGQGHHLVHLRLGK